MLTRLVHTCGHKLHELARQFVHTCGKGVMRMSRNWKTTKQVTYQWYMQAKADALGVPVHDWMHYRHDLSCKRCPHCGSGYIRRVTQDSIEGIVCEADEVCELCHEQVGFWAYGNYDPWFAYFYPRNMQHKIEMI